MEKIKLFDISFKSKAGKLLLCIQHRQKTCNSFATSPWLEPKEVLESSMSVAWSGLCCSQALLFVSSLTQGAESHLWDLPQVQSSPVDMTVDGRELWFIAPSPGCGWPEKFSRPCAAPSSSWSISVSQTRGEQRGSRKEKDEMFWKETKWKLKTLLTSSYPTTTTTFKLKEEKAKHWKYGIYMWCYLPSKCWVSPACVHHCQKPSQHPNALLEQHVTIPIDPCSLWLQALWVWKKKEQPSHQVHVRKDKLFGD